MKDHIMECMRFPKLSLDKHFFAIAIAIVVFAFVTRVWRVANPPNFYFDEVYHAFTATTFLHNDPKGYEFWQTPPKGVAYEWTHPPLAKLMMAGGMVVFGENSFGWRISSVLAGTGVVAATGWLAHTLYKNKKLTLLAMALVSFDGLLLTMSRIAMNDMHFVFFGLLSLVFYIRFKRTSSPKEAIFAAIMLGLSLASKWTALYIGAVIFVDYFFTLLFSKKIPFMSAALALLAGVVIIPSLYIASYSQFFLQGHTLKQWWDTTQQMWWYHTGLKATHTYQSKPWQWLLDLRPVWMYVDYSQNAKGMLAHIYNIGNPLLLWIGLSIAAVFGIQEGPAFLLRKTKKYEPETLFLLFLYLALWLPWMFSPRIMFFYHYSPSIPILAILTAKAFLSIAKGSLVGKRLVCLLVFLIALIFLVLYPINTALPMPKGYFDTLFSIFPTWK